MEYTQISQKVSAENQTPCRLERAIQKKKKPRSEQEKLLLTGV